MKKQIISGGEAARAIYIDFEGTVNDAPTFLGVLLPSGDFTQFVHEPVFLSAAAAKAKGSCDDCWCVASDLETSLLHVLQVAEEQDCQIVAWSARELIVAAETLGAGSNEYARFSMRYRNAVKLAQWWAGAHPGISIPAVNVKGKLPSKHPLAAFMLLSGYEVARAFGPGQNAQRIRAVRDQLLRHEEYARITPVAKGKWTKVLKHNWHDCIGTRHAVLWMLERQ